MLDGQGRNAGFEAAGRSQQVAGHRLRRVDDQLLRVVAEGELDRVALVHIAERRARAVRVDESPTDKNQLSGPELLARELGAKIVKDDR